MVVKVVVEKPVGPRACSLLVVLLYLFPSVSIAGKKLVLSQPEINKQN